MPKKRRQVCWIGYGEERSGIGCSAHSNINILAMPLDDVDIVFLTSPLRWHSFGGVMTSREASSTFLQLIGTDSDSQERSQWGVVVIEVERNGKSVKVLIVRWNKRRKTILLRPLMQLG